MGWVKRFIFFHEVRHPREMGKAEIEAFLNHLAMELGVAASTQSQALNALVFLCRYLIEREIGELNDLIRAKRPARLPVVMTVLPERVMPRLREKIAVSLALHRNDLAKGYGEVELPGALVRKYPNAGWEPRWQWVFPADRMSVCPRTGRMGRHHLFQTTMVYTHVLNRGGRGVRSSADLAGGRTAARGDSRRN